MVGDGVSSRMAITYRGTMLTPRSVCSATASAFKPKLTGALLAPPRLECDYRRSLVKARGSCSDWFLSGGLGENRCRSLGTARGLRLPG